jgi:hypothetical protein
VDLHSSNELISFCVPAGEIVYISAAGIPMVFLNDFKAYNDLLHNRGDIYSDKPRMVMTGELCGAEYMVRFGPPLSAPFSIR